MRPVIVALILLFSAILATGTPNLACNTLQNALPGSDEYTEDNEHDFVSSSEVSTCSVQPESAANLQVVACDNTRSPFAIKSGGHAFVLGFSSTPGVQVLLSRLNDLTYDAASSVAKVRAGLTWDKVYAQLLPSGVKVIGGCAPGVSVGGVLLGGRYSYFTNQYGLSINNIVAHDLVLPNRTFVVVTEASDPDIFFALKGSFNNFGVVTAFTLKTYPQMDVWVALVTYPISSADTVHQVIADWSINNKDSKGAVIPFYLSSGGQVHALDITFLQDTYFTTGIISSKPII
ncbi:putative fad dependent oxidoreductase [Moniliophthora roreri]|nr:putative fad dependent oxidoreductase [Moniliophthora roreri]